MNIIITKTAEDSFLESYLYIHARSPLSADRIYDEVIDYIFDNLSAFPKLGRLYNSDKGIYRLVHAKTGYNIYYLIKDEALFIIYIIDGDMNLNQDIERKSFTLPPTT